MEVDKTFSWKKEKVRNNSPFLPEDIRGLVVGSSNAGKTCLILNLLLNPGWLDYDHLYVFSKSLHQTEYIILKKGLESGLSKEQVGNLFHNQHSIKSPVELIENYLLNGGTPKGGITAEFYDDCKLIPDPSSLNEEDKNLMIFDDCILEKQNKCQKYFTRGRHSNCNCWYISQNYFTLDRRTIRENSNIIILFPQNPKNLTHIHQDHCGEISFQNFKDFCNQVWSEKYNFVTLDLTRSSLGKYRQNFDRFFNPHTMSFEDLANGNKVVQEYSDMVKRIRQKNENEKTHTQHRLNDLKETFEPILNATKEQTKELKAQLHQPTPENTNGPLTDALDFYLHRYPKTKLDVNYGIRDESGRLMMGDTEVDVKDNNIHVKEHEFKGTNDLWSLIMVRNPQTLGITPETLQDYKNLIRLTNTEEYVMNNYKGNYEQLAKTKLLRESGTGISFLPSNINDLLHKLNLLLGEFNAGNRAATQNQIVAIVDNLVSRKKFTKEEAAEINNYLEQNASD
jgi:hypothetical protein